MTHGLLDAVRRHSALSQDAGEQVITPIEGLTIIRETHPGEIRHHIAKPLICFVLQGAKQASTGGKTAEFGVGESLLILSHVPIVSQITKASVHEPYLSLAIDLDAALISELAIEMQDAPQPSDSPLQTDPSDEEALECAARIMRLLDKTEACPVLYRQLVRELHYWLLTGKHGDGIRRLGWAGGHEVRIGRAIGIIRERFREPLSVDELADIANMSPSSFHHHFKATTSLSPVQFQKQLRLIEARRLMTVEAVSASRAAYAVGYESVSQFTREYGRLFGRSPARDAQELRGAREPQTV